MPVFRWTRAPAYERIRRVSALVSRVINNCCNCYSPDSLQPTRAAQDRLSRLRSSACLRHAFLPMHWFEQKELTRQMVELLQQYYLNEPQGPDIRCPDLNGRAITKDLDVHRSAVRPTP